MKTNKIKHITYEFTFDSVEADMLYYIMNTFLANGDLGRDPMYENMYEKFAHSIIQEVDNDED